MTSEAVVRRPLLLVAIDAKSHRVIDHTLRYRHLAQITMTRRALHLPPDMRCMIEPHVRLFHKSINPLPRDVLTPLRGRAQRLDPRIIRLADLFMTAHTYIDTGNAGARALHHAQVAVLAEKADIVGMDLMGELDGLHRPRLDAEEMSGGIAEARMRGGEGGRRPSFGRVRIERRPRISRHARLLDTAAEDRQHRCDHYRA
jgi:hypothetical protein